MTYSTMFGGEDGVTDLPSSHASATSIRTLAGPRGDDCFPETGNDPTLVKHRASRENVAGFFEIPYFFNATYLLMEIKGLVMYPKG
jgi:hypothetical protein